MYKVLIVDDEPTVREGLKSIIPWKDYGFDVAGSADDGYSGLEQFKKLNPDLIISDICMPGMDGLEFIKCLRKENYTGRCLILSGYADFEYAKKAIQSNVTDYILKPVDEEELIASLAKVKHELLKQQEMSDLTSSHADKEREEVVLSLIHGPHNMLKDEFAAKLNKLKMDWPQYDILLVKPEGTEQQQSLAASIKSDIMTTTDDERTVVFTYESYISLLLNSTAYNKKERHLLCTELKDICARYETSVTIAFGGAVGSADRIKESFNRALSLLRKRFFFPDMVLLDEAVVLENKTKSDESVSNIIDQLFFALDIGVYDSVEQQVDSIVCTIENDYCENDIKKKYVFVLTSVLNKLRYAKPEKESFLSDELAKVLEVYQAKDIRELNSCAKKLLKNVYDEIAYNETEDQMKKLLLLIDSQYYESLKLEKLASLFNYNSAYLGKLFKNYTGEYFNTYLDKKRIEHAKKFLMQGKKVYHVAETVGYSSVDYFHSKFKKYTGVSPSVYRRKKQRN